MQAVTVGKVEVIRNLIFVFQTTHDFPFLECCLAGGVDCENSRVSIFVCVALRAASILRNHILLYLINVLQVPKHLFLVGFEQRECLRTLSFAKFCTRQS